MEELTKSTFHALIAGKNGSGKSHLIKYIINMIMNDKPFDYIFVFSNTAHFSEDYDFLKDYKHKIYIPDGFDNKLLKIMQIQKNRKNKGHILLVFDDIMGSIKTSKNFNAISSQNRHFNFSVIFSIQYIAACTPSYREICRFVFIFDQSTKNSLNLTFENFFFDKFDNINSFKKWFCKKLKQYEFIFVDKKNNKKSIMKCP